MSTQSSIVLGLQRLSNALQTTTFVSDADFVTSCKKILTLLQFCYAKNLTQDQLVLIVDAVENAVITFILRVFPAIVEKIAIPSFLDLPVSPSILLSLLDVVDKHVTEYGEFILQLRMVAIYQLLHDQEEVSAFLSVYFTSISPQAHISTNTEIDPFSEAFGESISRSSLLNFRHVFGSSSPKPVLSSECHQLPPLLPSPSTLPCVLSETHMIDTLLSESNAALQQFLSTYGALCNTPDTTQHLPLLCNAVSSSELLTSGDITQDGCVQQVPLVPLEPSTSPKSPSLFTADGHSSPESASLSPVPVRHTPSPKPQLVIAKNQNLPSTSIQSPQRGNTIPFVPSLPKDSFFNIYAEAGCIPQILATPPLPPHPDDHAPTAVVYSPPAPALAFPAPAKRNPITKPLVTYMEAKRKTRTRKAKVAPLLMPMPTRSGRARTRAASIITGSVNKENKEIDQDSSTTAS